MIGANPFAFVVKLGTPLPNICFFVEKKTKKDNPASIPCFKEDPQMADALYRQFSMFMQGGKNILPTVGWGNRFIKKRI